MFIGNFLFKFYDNLVWKYCYYFYFREEIDLYEYLEFFSWKGVELNC